MIERDDSINPTTSRRRFLKGAALAGAAVAAGGLPMQADENSSLVPGQSYDVRKLGAKGDGQADDTAAVQAAIDAAVKSHGGHIYIPSGKYRITKSLTFSSADRFDVTGDGRSSVLLHENNEPLLLWKEDAPCRESTVRDLSLLSVKNDKSPDVAVIDCRGGAERSFFSNLYFAGSGARMGSGVFAEKVMDTTSFDHCLMWGIGGTGIKVARGSEVRIFGARITGSNPYNGVSKTTIAVHLTGNNGGVHIVTTDLIGVHTGLRIGDPGAQSNREVMITHATFDSNVYGIHQVDNTYLSIAGCWTASSDEAQILIDKDAHGAIVVIAGGTIFNGGAYGREGSAHGMVVRAGSFVLSGLTVRNNKGVGLLVEENVRDYAVTGCRFVENGTAAELRGDNFTFTGNVFARNKKGLIDLGGASKVVQANVGV